MTKQAIGIIGTIGAGKDTAGDYLGQRLGWPSYQISSPLKELLVESGEELSRENLIALGTKLAHEKGPAYLAEYILAHAPNKLIITGMRQLEQIEYLRSSCDLTIIAIDASPEIRFKRIGQTGKLGEADTLSNFMACEKAENSAPNVQRLFECLKLADLFVKNEGSLEDLYAQLDKLIIQLRLS